MLEVFLVIGQSTSGKTTLASKILRSQTRPVVVVNDKTDEMRSWKKAEWKEVSSLENVAVLVEDVMRCTDVQLAVLAKLVKFQCHHRNVGPVIMVAHTFQHNRMGPVLECATHLIFTTSAVTLRSVVAAADYYKFDSTEKNDMKQKFLSTAKKYGYFVMDLQKRTFVEGEEDDFSRLLGGGGGPTSAVAGAKSGIDVSRYLAHVRNPEKARLVYDIITKSLPVGTIDDHFTVKMHKKKSGEAVEVNLIDFLDCLMSEKARPSAAYRHFFGYVRKLANFPSCLVENEGLKVSSN